MNYSLIGWLIAMCLIPVVVIIIGKFFTKKSADYNFTKDVLVPVSTPLVVAIIGVVFTLQSEEQQKSDQQTAVMREIMVSQDRHDTAFLIAVDTQLASHLRRLQAHKPITDPYTNFDEEAVFFFYGLHRSENVH